MTWLRRVGLGIAWLVLFLAALAVSVVYHLDLTETREVARGAIVTLASTELAGDLKIGSIEELGLGRVVFHDVTMLDEARCRVIFSREVVAYPDLDRLFTDGTIRIAAGIVTRPDIALYVVNEQGDLDPTGLEVSFARAFIPIDHG